MPFFKAPIAKPKLLTTNQKIKAATKKIPPPHEKRKKISQKNLEGIKRELKLLIAFYGIGTPHRELSEQPKLSREQIAIMDIDFEGLYFTPQPEMLSPTYLKLKYKPVTDTSNFPYSPSDYELNKIPIWKEMKKFNSFRSVYRPICRRLAQISYPPQKLDQLNIHDMLDLIGKHNRETPTHRMPCQRTRFLKMFASCYGDEFTEKMTAMGKGKEAADFLTYISYIDNPKQKCPPEVRYAAELFNVHHVKNRKHAEEFDDYAKVNDFSNLSLCFVFPHHKILHTPTEIDLNPNIIFFGSFLNEFQIMRNPQKEREYIQNLTQSSQSKEQLR